MERTLLAILPSTLAAFLVVIFALAGAASAQQIASVQQTATRNPPPHMGGDDALGLSISIARPPFVVVNEAAIEAAFVDDHPLLTFQEIMLGTLDGAAEVAWSLDGAVAGDPLAFSSRESRFVRAGDVVQSSALRIDRDFPLLGGVNVTSDSAISRASDRHGSGIRRQSADSRVGLVYRDRGITLRFDPDVTVEWGDQQADLTRLGVSHEIFADLADDLTLTLASGYEVFSYPANRLDNYYIERRRIGLTYRHHNGYRFGVSALSRSRHGHYATRNLFGPGFSLTMPLSETWKLRANNEFYFAERDFRRIDRSEHGYLQSFGLHIDWTPALLASRALSVVTGYSFNYDTAPVNNDPAFQGVAKLALALKF